jgi:hypothetical protein
LTTSPLCHMRAVISRVCVGIVVFHWQHVRDAALSNHPKGHRSCPHSGGLFVQVAGRSKCKIVRMVAGDLVVKTRSAEIWYRK